MKKKDHQHFVKAMEAMLVSLGAVPGKTYKLGDPVYKDYDFILITRHGPLGLSVNNRKSEVSGTIERGTRSCFWPGVYGRFEDHDKARAAGLDCNPFSGKWNHLWARAAASHAPYIVGEFEDTLKRILP